MGRLGNLVSRVGANDSIAKKTLTWAAKFRLEAVLRARRAPKFFWKEVRWAWNEIRLRESSWQAGYSPCP
jgi:hypothetical protein